MPTNKASKKNDHAKNTGAEGGRTSAAVAAAPFPIAAVGASAGGLQAFIELLSALPALPGLAVVFVLHTDSRDSTSLRDVLARKSKLPVEVAVDGEPVLINRVYIPPPGSFLLFKNGNFLVSSRDRASTTLPIDGCFESLAGDRGNRAIGVVLSGTASDGALGTTAIKGEGGITFAQDHETAQSQDMPDNAVLTGAIDFVLPPADIGRELVQLAHHPHMTVGVAAGLGEKNLSKIFDLLHGSHDVDFTHYKKSTLERRIRRRMTVHRLESVEKYVELLKGNRAELDALYNDILIRVTGFFRDPEVFEALCSQIIPQMLHDRAPVEPVRVWVPGCSTGEEVYSLAMCIVEAIDDGTYSCPVQIFGTDINDHAVDRARAGFY